MSVNVKLQCLATLTLPTGLYAFKRINKLTMGIIIYGITFATWLGQMLLVPTNSIGLFGLLSFMNLVLGITLPMIFIYNWSKDFNQKIKKENISII